MRVHSLEVSNFRSIRGTVQCNLDASIILVHGPNGAGKTSIMSARSSPVEWCNEHSSRMSLATQST